MAGTRKFSFVLLGTKGSGKTSVLKRFTSGSAPAASDIAPTVGVTIASKTTDVEGIPTKLEFVDCRGEDGQHSRALTEQISAFYAKAQAVFLFFDVTNTSSLSTTLQLLKKNAAQWPADCEIVIVGNKIDDLVKRSIAKEDIDTKIAELKTEFPARTISYKEVSAKTGDGVDDLFVDVAKRVSPKIPAPVAASAPHAIEPAKSEEPGKIDIKKTLYSFVQNNRKVLHAAVGIGGGVLAGGVAAVVLYFTWPLLAAVSIVLAIGVAVAAACGVGVGSFFLGTRLGEHLHKRFFSHVSAVGDGKNTSMVRTLQQFGVSSMGNPTQEQLQDAGPRATTSAQQPSGSNLGLRQQLSAVTKEEAERRASPARASSPAPKF